MIRWQSRVRVYITVLEQGVAVCWYLDKARQCAGGVVFVIAFMSGNDHNETKFRRFGCSWEDH